MSGVHSWATRCYLYSMWLRYKLSFFQFTNRVKHDVSFLQRLKIDWWTIYGRIWYLFDAQVWNAIAVLCWMLVICKAVTCVVMFYYCNVKSQIHDVMLTFHNVKSCHHDVMLTFYNVVSQCHDVMHINLCVK